MNPNTLISAGIALLAFATGVLLLGKAYRENHGVIYKISGWFVIIASLLIMGCGAVHSAMRFYSWQYMHNNTMEMHGKRMMDWMWRDGHDDSYRHRFGRSDDDMDRYDGDYYRRDNEAYGRRRRYDEQRDTSDYTRRNR